MVAKSGPNAMDFLIRYADNNKLFTRHEVFKAGTGYGCGHCAVRDAISSAIDSGHIKSIVVKGKELLTRGMTGYKSQGYESPLRSHCDRVKSAAWV